MPRLIFVSIGLALLAPTALAQAPAAPGGPQPNLVSNIERPLRYRPEGQDFVIENGTEFFNRPLYGGNTAFRVDAGDKPEFVLYLPGRGGNLRFGLRTPAGAKWLFDAAHITTRYRPGEMHYEIRDPLLGTDSLLRLAVVALHQTEGLIARIELQRLPVAGVGDPGPASPRPATADGVELIWAYGGVSGERGRRDGDIGTENVPISEWFQFRPEFCRDNTFTTDGNQFTLRSAAATIVGTAPSSATLAVINAELWNSDVGPDFASGPSPADEAEAARTQGPALQIITGRVPLPASQPLFLALQRVGDTGATSGDLSTYRDVTTAPPGAQTTVTASLLPVFAADDLPGVFDGATAHFAALRNQITVETPDPFINAAVTALNVAADAVWDEPQGDIMHGAIAWRTRLLGWRGPYALDALGWHERARKHFRYWATRQNTDAIPEELPPPDEHANLARSEAALHSNGDMSQSHYDMNLVFIDALFRHLLWTGDRDFAHEMWPVIERHLAWERRLFRREFGPEKLPLYEAYAAIWASDDLQYNGGGVTHASAYNYWHNTMAARVARWLGEDPTIYETEAAAIQRAMHTLLWLPEQSMFGEFKDLLGLQRVHPSAALWSFYQVLDAPGLVDAGEASAMTHYVDTQIPYLPVRGPGVPADDIYAVRSTSNWMPYTWSINNVVMSENVHTALGFWQAGRGDDAFRLMKSALLASMFIGICPGNVGSMNYLDVYRRESQRDFADGNGVTARAIVEGLFGIRPDAIAGELRIEPGFPENWDHAKIKRLGLAVTFERHDRDDVFVIEQESRRPMNVRLSVASWHPDAAVRVNGKSARWRRVADGPEREPRFEFECGNNKRIKVSFRRLGRPPPRNTSLVISDPFLEEPAQEFGVDTQFAVLDLAPFFNDRVTEIFRPGKYRSPRSPFVSLAIPAQGIGAWAGHVNASAEIDDTGLRRAAGENGGRFVLPNGVPFATPGPGDAPNILFTSLWDNYPDEATVLLAGYARGLFLLMAGSTNHMQSQFNNGEVIVAYTDGTTARLALHNPTNWWPIEQDYFIDDFQFRRPEPIPPRVNLKTGEIRILDVREFKGRGSVVPGGAATVLELELDPAKELQSLTVRALANEVVIGLMAATLVR